MTSSGTDENGWADISTAPKDGTKVLIWHDGIYSAWFEVEYSWVTSGGAWIDAYARSDTYEYKPTHWKPSPKPPVASPLIEGE